MTAKKPRNHVDDLRGAAKLAVDATNGVTSVVETMHHTIASGPAILGKPLELPSRVVTGLVYRSIRGVTEVAGKGIDLFLAQLAPLLDASPAERAPSRERDALVAAVNGVVGDTLEETGNPLAITMRIRSGGVALDLDRESLRAALPAVTGKLLLLVHGSSMSDQWGRKGHDHGAALARDLGFTPVYLHYNSGRHVSTNGRELAALLEQLVSAWPVPMEAFAIVGHSMGGLVARSACHYAELAGHGWRAKLQKLVCIGTPHHGAPLERGGNLFEVLLGVSRYSAPLATLGKLRSAGVTDLRFGSTLDEEWQGRDRFAPGADPRTELALPEGVACYAMAGTKTAQPGGVLLGDGLVPVASALGRHEKGALDLGFPEARRHLAYGTGHFDLLGEAAYPKLREWLAE